MLAIKTSFVLLIHSHLASLIVGVRYFNVRLHNFTYEITSSRIDECVIETTDRDGVAYFNGILRYREPINEATIHIVIDVVPKTANMYRVFDHTWDLCKGFKESFRSNLVSAIYSDINKFGHLPHSCPLQPHVNFTVKDFHLVPEQFPPYTPELTFITNMTVFFREEYAGGGIIVGIVESKNKKSRSVQGARKV